MICKYYTPLVFSGLYLPMLILAEGSFSQWPNISCGNCLHFYLNIFCLIDPIFNFFIDLFSILIFSYLNRHLFYFFRVIQTTHKSFWSLSIRTILVLYFQIWNYYSTLFIYFFCFNSKNECLDFFKCTLCLNDFW